MVTVKSFFKAEDAYLLRSLLESEGVPAFIRDEYISQMDWFYTNAVGGVKVEVADDDVEAAREVLAKNAASTPDPVPCPYCNSTDTAWQDWSRRLSFLTSFIWSFPLPVMKSRRHCHSCGKEWNEWDRPEDQAA